MPDWKTHGVRIVRAGEFDSNTPQTPGMTRAAAITAAKAGAQKLWAGTVRVDPDARTAAHHHGDLRAGERLAGAIEHRDLESSAVGPPDGFDPPAERIAGLVAGIVRYLELPVRRILDAGCGVGLLKEPLLARTPDAARQTLQCGSATGAAVPQRYPRGPACTSPRRPASFS